MNSASGTTPTGCTASSTICLPFFEKTSPQWVSGEPVAAMIASPWPCCELLKTMSPSCHFREEPPSAASAMPAAVKAQAVTNNANFKFIPVISSHQCFQAAANFLHICP